MFSDLITGFTYVETHYRFKAGFTFLSRKAPEILFDAPFRIDPGQPITAILIIKDADKFPIELINITAAITLSPKHRIFIKEIKPDEQFISTNLFYQTMAFPLPDDFSGMVRLTFKLDLKINNKKTFVLNDNIPFASHSDYAVYASSDPLPALPGYIYGETHFHSHLTNDQVEYGIPLKAVPALAQSMGLKFAFATDHSYDLDTRNPFNKSKETFAELNETAALSNHDFILVPGEEVSVKNRRGKTVHICVINNPHFIEGYGDCGRSMFQTTCSHSIENIVKETGSPETLVFAAHPGYKEGLFERLLLNRGRWDINDYDDGLHITQFWNGNMDKSFFRGKRDWVSLLLAGKRIFAIGGNDAHGDFNRTRKIGIPFITIKEDKTQRFGTVRTAVKTDSLTSTGIIAAIKAGRVIMTNGPFACLKVLYNDTIYETGDTLQVGQFKVLISALSTLEFGQLSFITLIKGTINNKENKIFTTRATDKEKYCYSADLPIAIDKPSYLRLEVTSKAGNNIFYAFSNPIFFKLLD